jgi:hypothetical protein
MAIILLALLHDRCTCMFSLIGRCTGSAVQWGQCLNANDFRCVDTHSQAALDKASNLLDMVVAGSEPSYDAVRARLAEAYTEAGLRDVANFITSAT